ncbi:hypothetical protein MKX67_06195 [Cytobacillus sp. FSL W7-1323]|uniref:hypothetical protein n=1 Tax=Cytobacillus TaxID=2675230 RepID=UPI0027869F3A|nr:MULTISPECIES: hypothetical protein [Cytobacillus]MDQ0186821.1 hypothetical protein [Cytobacillus kochii]MEA1854277.1 hypothetical protein [Cytobacillus sp. OWB-43]MED1607102.1 hypothetical protein [Cytobacillus kochii]
MNTNRVITNEVLVRYAELSRLKKQIDEELGAMKKVFNEYFDQAVGRNEKGELILSQYKLQRQIRVKEQYDREKTVNKLESINQHQLIQKIPDEKRIQSALDLEIIDDKDLSDCKTTQYTKVIVVKAKE